MHEDLDQEYLESTVLKYRPKFEIYSEAEFFCIGYLLANGYNWEESKGLARKVLIATWEE